VERAQGREGHHRVAHPVGRAHKNPAVGH
jgi:hypothetical protein